MLLGMMECVRSTRQTKSFGLSPVHSTIELMSENVICVQRSSTWNRGVWAV